MFRPNELAEVQNKIFEHNRAELTSLLSKQPISPKNIHNKNKFYSRNCLSLLLNHDFNLIKSIGQTRYGIEYDDTSVPIANYDDIDYVIETMNY